MEKICRRRPYRGQTGRLKVYFGHNLDSCIKVRVYFVLRHQVYGDFGFSIIDSERVALQDITLYSVPVPGMGVYASNTHNISLRDVGVRRKPGLPMSITADTTYFNEYSGLVELLGIYFEGQGDDGLNVHGMFHDVREERSRASSKRWLCHQQAVFSVSDICSGEQTNQW
jgi:hypothetical protein